MSDGTDILDGATEMWPDNVVAIRYAGENADLTGTVTDAFSTGVEALRAITEQGMYNGQDGIVRYAQSDEPTAWATDHAIVGQVVEVQLPGDEDWSRLRVARRLVMAGAVRLNLTSEFEEM